MSSIFVLFIAISWEGGNKSGPDKHELYNPLTTDLKCTTQRSDKAIVKVTFV